MLSRTKSYLAVILTTIGLAYPAYGQSVSSASCVWQGTDGEIVSQSCTLQRINQKINGGVLPRYIIKWQDGFKTDISWNIGLDKYSTPEGTVAELDGLFFADGLRFPKKINLVGLGKVYISSQCNLRQAIYEDVDGHGGQLEFIGNPQNISQAKAIIKHKSRGTIFSLELDQSNGYGSTWAGVKDARGAKTSGNHEVYFFEADLKSASGILGRLEAKPYIFITGLGSSDYYNNSARGQSIMDPLWKFSRCKT